MKADPRSVALALAILLASTLPPLRAQTASLVADLAPGAESGQFIAYDLQPLRDSVLFTAYHPPLAEDQLWVSDGTANGTRILEEICPGACGGRRHLLGTLGGVALWGGRGEGRDHLWRSDGTREGTFLLGAGSLALGGLVDALGSSYAFAGGNLYFVGSTEEHGDEIWRTDGTREGTRLVQDLTPGRDSSSIREIAAAGDQVFVLLENEIRLFGPDGSRRIHAFDGRSADLWPVWKERLFFRNGGALWTSDGTPAGTRLLLESVGFESLRWMGAGPQGIYFTAVDPVHGAEVWRSDGTPPGTRRLTDLPENIVLGALSDFRDATAAVEIAGTLLFVAYDTDTGPRLYRLAAGSGSVAPVSKARVEQPLIQLGDRVVFTTSRFYEEDCEIWSAGARGASVRLAGDPSCITSPLIRIDAFQVVRDRVYFTTRSPAGLQLWRSDGTSAGTAPLFSADPAAYWGFAVSPDGRSVFISMDQGLWLWEAAEGLRQIAGPGPRTQSTAPSELTALGNRLFFNNCGSLWTSTGTAASTRLVAFPGGLYCGHTLVPIAAGSSLFFLDPAHRELWATDAAAGAPQLLARDLGIIHDLAAHQGTAWFVVRAGAHSEIWRSDGTPAGTRVAVALPGDTLIVSPLSSAGGLLYFSAHSGPDGSGSREIWRSDGTPAGTFPLADNEGYAGFDFTHLGPLTWFLTVRGLWRTDGTPAGTVLLRDAGGQALVWLPYNLTAQGGSLYLFGARAVADWRLTLWRTNGTPENTVPLATFPPELHGSPASSDLIPFRGRLFFTVDDGIHGEELWVTDGTAAGTALVADVAPGPASSSPGDLTVAGDLLFFSAHDGPHGRELWQTDGTAAGTRMVQDIAPEGLSAAPALLTAVGDRLDFTADDGLTGGELWSLPLAGAAGCQASPTRLCLNGGRYQAEVSWRDFASRTGRGTAVSLTADTGYFWFFDPANAEVIVKVLDGQGLNQHVWVFYGALSNVEYTLTVTDTRTGLARRYLNPAGQLASVGDTTGFGPLGAHSPAPEALVAPPSPPALVAARTVPAAATGTCQPGPRRLCLNGGRFAVEASWKDFAGNTGAGTAVPLTPDTGTFWFFDAANVEVLLKVLDGRPLNGKFWVFYGALSNVEYTLTVTDTETGAVKEYRNPSGRFASVADTGAF